jgi:hypothetical protein
MSSIKLLSAIYFIIQQFFFTKCISTIVIKIYSLKNYLYEVHKCKEMEMKLKRL